jgi:hypothetical protein
LTTLAIIVVLASVGCTASPGSTPPAASLAAPSVSPSPRARPTGTPALPSPTSTPPATTYTPEDERISVLIRSGAETAITQLRLLNDMDPNRLEDLFLPLDAWISAQIAEAEASTPSACTAAAVEGYLDGLFAYDAIRKTFLAWRDWGAQGHPFPRGAPREAAGILEDAVVELDALCPA